MNKVTIETNGPKGRYRVIASDGSSRFHTNSLRDALDNADALALTEEGEVSIKDLHSGDELKASDAYVFAAVRWMLETDEVALKLRREIG